MGKTNKRTKLARRGKAPNDAKPSEPLPPPATTEFVKRRPGRNLPDVMSSVLFHSDYHAMFELISNAFDADAENVWITYSPKENYLLVEDDGTGCDAEGMDAFYRIGDSTKQTRKLTEKGRKPIGKYGIATLLLKYLGSSYELSTWRGGERRTVRENLDSELTMDKQIPVQFHREKDKTRHGMRIKISGLNAVRQERDFDVDALVKKVRREMPLRQDFHIFINDEEIRPAKIEKGIEYYAEEDIGGVGRVFGSFFVCSSSIKEPEDRGVHIKINGRMVGDPHYFRIGQKFKAGLETRLTATVYADGLDPCIGFDRTNLKTDHPKFKSVETAINKTLSSISHDYRKETEGREKEKTKKGIEQTVKAVVDQLMKQYPKLVRGMQFAKEDEAGVISRFDADERKIYVNAESIRVNSTRELADVLRDASTHALVNYELLQKFPNSPVARKIVEARDNIEVQNMMKLRGNQKKLSTILKEASEEAQYSLNPYRLYSPHDLERITGVSYLTTRRLRECGLLPEAKVSGEKRREQYFASDFQAAANLFEGHTHVLEILKSMSATDDVELNMASETTLTRRLEALNDKQELPGYMLRLGKDSNVCYFVKKDAVEQFKELYLSGTLRIRPGRKAGEIGAGQEEVAGEPAEIGSLMRPWQYDPTQKYQSGHYVNHTVYGPGKIIKVSGQKMSVDFGKAGTKQLAMGIKSD